MENEYNPIGDLYNLIVLAGKGITPKISEIDIRFNNGNFVYEVRYEIPETVAPKFFRPKPKNRGLNKEADDLQERLFQFGLKPVSDEQDKRNFSRRRIYIE